MWYWCPSPSFLRKVQQSLPERKLGFKLSRPPTHMALFLVTDHLPRSSFNKDCIWLCLVLESSYLSPNQHVGKEGKILPLLVLGRKFALPNTVASHRLITQHGLLAGVLLQYWSQVVIQMDQLLNWVSEQRKRRELAIPGCSSPFLKPGTTGSISNTKFLLSLLDK